MSHAAITGWGKCLPPAVLTNADLATFLDTDDAWITTRTGIAERRISHVLLEDLAEVAARRALAAAGLAPEALELIVFGTAASTTRCRTRPPVCSSASVRSVRRRWTSTRRAPVSCTRSAPRAP